MTEKKSADDKKIERNLRASQWGRKASPAPSASGATDVVSSTTEGDTTLAADIPADKRVEFLNTLNSQERQAFGALPPKVQGSVFTGYVKADSVEAYTDLRKKLHNYMDERQESLNTQIEKADTLLRNISRGQYNKAQAAKGEHGKMLDENGDLVSMSEREKIELRKQLEPSDALRSWLAENEPDKYRAPELHMEKKTAMARGIANALSMAMAGLGGSRATLQAAGGTQAATAGALRETRKLNEKQKALVDERNFKIMQKYRQNVVDGEAAMDKAMNASQRAYVQAVQNELTRKQAAFFGVMGAKNKLQQLRNNLIVAQASNAQSIEKSQELADRFNASNELKANIANSKMRQQASIAMARLRQTQYRNQIAMKKLRQSQQLQSVLGVQGEEKLSNSAVAMSAYGIGGSVSAAIQNVTNSPKIQGFMHANNTEINTHVEKSIRAIDRYVRDEVGDVSDESLNLKGKMLQNLARLWRAGFPVDPAQEVVQEQLTRENLFVAGDLEGGSPTLKVNKDVLEKLERSSAILKVPGMYSAGKRGAKAIQNLRRVYGEAAVVFLGLHIGSDLDKQAVRKKFEDD